MVAKNNDPVMANRGNANDSASSTMPTGNHKVQKPSNRPDDPIQQARSPRGGTLKRQGSIGVAGATGILKESSISPKNANGTIHHEDSSLESIGVFEGFDNNNNNVNNDDDDDTLDDNSTFDTLGQDQDTFGTAADLSLGNTTAASSTQFNRRRSVRFGKGTKAGRHGCGAAPSFGALYKGIVDNLAEMKLVSKLDRSARELGKGLEGLGMTCTGGSRMMCGACGSAVNAGINAGGCDEVVGGGIGGSCGGRCAKCGVNVPSDSCASGSSVSDYINEENDLVAHTPGEKRRDDRVLMRDTMLEARDAIKESRDAIVASRDAILGSYSEMKESRQCVEESRSLLGDCREAIIQSNNVAVMAKGGKLGRITAGKTFTFEQLGYGAVGGNDDDDGSMPLNSPRSRRRKQQPYSTSPIEKYRHASSSLLRASQHNIETGMDTADELISAEIDPFSASMHAYQRSPHQRSSRRAIMPTSPQKDAGIQTATQTRAKPTSILKNNKRSTSIANARANTSRARQLMGMRSKDKKYRNMSTKAVSVKNSKNNAYYSSATSSSGRTRDKTADKTAKQQHSSSNVAEEKRKKKKNGMSRRVIGGLKKPLKFMSHGVKSTIKNSRPTRILALSAASPAPAY